MKRWLAPAALLLSLALYFAFAAALETTSSRRAEGAAGAAYMLGPLRPLLADLLWLSAIEAQDAKRYYEAHDIALYIASLQPHYDEAWRFIAWNLAYNISWDHTTPSDRFFWIREGAELLEQKGLANNPDSFIIPFELAWIYYHRLSPKGQDPYLDYFEEYLSPPADWLQEKGFAYRGLRLKMRRGELRVYERDAPMPPAFALGPYQPGEQHRPDVPYAVFVKPASALLVPGTPLAEGAQLLVAVGADVLTVPAALAGAAVLHVSLEDCRNGWQLPTSPEATVWLAFPPDRYECWRLAVKWLHRALASPAAKGVDGLNAGSCLAHAYENMGLFDEAEATWGQLAARYPEFADRLRHAARNFYYRIIHFYGGRPDLQDAWYERLKSFLPSEELDVPAIVRIIDAELSGRDTGDNR